MVGTGSLERRRLHHCQPVSSLLAGGWCYLADQMQVQGIPDLALIAALATRCRDRAAVRADFHPAVTLGMPASVETLRTEEAEILESAFQTSIWIRKCRQPQSPKRKPTVNPTSL